MESVHLYALFHHMALHLTLVNNLLAESAEELVLDAIMRTKVLE
jgi:hypothetical protein